MVISYKEISDDEGNIYKIMSDYQEFTVYEEAEAFITSQETGNYVMVSGNPFVSPVPLEPLEHYQFIYGSDDILGTSDNSTTSMVKVFEYVK